MPFKVSKISGLPQFDSLPIAKVTRYPLEKRDYKPYAQCILCVGESALTLRMWAFEVSPSEDSSLRCVLYLYKQDPERAVCMDVYSRGHIRVALLRAGEAGEEPIQLESESYTAAPFGGEDLQGVYWGSTLTVPLEALRAMGGPLALETGDSFPGNFYKLCTQQPFVHSGSCFPADFAANPYTKDNMGDFQVVPY